MTIARIGVSLLATALCCGSLYAKNPTIRYFAHRAVLDRYGVIEPWYVGQNGQFDNRVRIAAETLKRYPWTRPGEAPVIAPEYAYNNTWKIAPNGTITIPKLTNWANGGRGQASARVLGAWVSYYEYTGDPAAIAQVKVVADALLETCLTASAHSWPDFLISVPVAGKPYGQASDQGFIQLDIVGEAGVALLDAYQLTGDVRYFDIVKHWGDVFAEKRDRQPGKAPWGRYANPEDVPWGDTRAGRAQTGGVVYELAMMDELIRLGYRGKDNGIVEARDAARAFLKNVLLPSWLTNDTWGRNYWDWQDPVQSQTTTDWVGRYLMDHPREFPNWRADVRNILTLFLNHTSVSPKSDGGVYSGAWAFPESDGCCGRSLAWGPLFLGIDFAQYGSQARDPWATELARRMEILATYDSLESGVVEDKIHGGTVAAGDWFNGTHPSALYYVLRAIAWMPELMAPSRENHVVRSSAIVNYVSYGKGEVSFSTFDAPQETTTVLRLSFGPSEVGADGRSLRAYGNVQQMTGNGYTAAALANGDFVVTIRHDGAKSVTIRGVDPQRLTDDGKLSYRGTWTVRRDASAYGGTEHVTSIVGSETQFSFTGNQVRVLGAVGPGGGKAAVYIDGVKRLAGIDYWNPRTLHKQVVYYRNGLSQGNHTILIVALHDRNAYSTGGRVDIDCIESSAAAGSTGFGEGGGPTSTQRMIFGYPDRHDYVDMEGHAWRPATEFIARTGDLTDSVAQTWWALKQAVTIYDTPEPEVYSYGVHAPDFTVCLTVAPGTYHVRLLFAETHPQADRTRAMDVYINDRLSFRRLDISATAKRKGEADSGRPIKAESELFREHPGYLGIPGADLHSPTYRAVDLVVNDVRPENGLIKIRLRGVKIDGEQSEAMLQALQVGPGREAGGDVAVSAH
jgi:Malectin domain